MRVLQALPVVVALVSTATAFDKDYTYKHTSIDITPLEPCVQECMDQEKNRWDYTDMSRYQFCEAWFNPGTWNWIWDHVNKCARKRCTLEEAKNSRDTFDTWFKETCGFEFGS
ncbi:uncharacterized protein K452DRAFT_149460 [Aplosporella prunicola CBS 121167]|uniref:Extracellular membrane protein CFEM domain-containing protein n=1 Tax=Aplosporella prunicola CBS 121167 TaxID=1176127 RepID=A0A6A6AWL8_9PEZI|nr:uncharacterized protein K452DRAFT_149460 [Aplosporella prunicola CBS 121167]KAF2135996.1 hypothetical protein K452DRAFT_149460 [Aplosporella prunicola CBS 121167]